MLPLSVFSPRVCFRWWGTWITAFWGLLSYFLHTEEKSIYTATKSPPRTGERSEGERKQSDAALWVQPPMIWNPEIDSWMYWVLMGACKNNTMAKVLYTAQTALKKLDDSHCPNKKKDEWERMILSSLCCENLSGRMDRKERALCWTRQGCQNWLQTRNASSCFAHVLNSLT